MFKSICLFKTKIIKLLISNGSGLHKSRYITYIQTYLRTGSCICGFIVCTNKKFYLMANCCIIQSNINIITLIVFITFGICYLFYINSCFYILFCIEFLFTSFYSSLFDFIRIVDFFYGF